MENKEFCVREHKLVIISVVLLLVGVIIWTIFEEIAQRRKGVPAGLGGRQAAMQPVAAGKIPISIGQTVPHPNYGHDCMQCHVLLGKDPKPAIQAGPIMADVAMPHPFWGVCIKCHEQISPKVKTKTKVAGFTDPGGGRNLMGAELITVTPDLAAQYRLPPDGGVLVNALDRGSAAEVAGFQQGDIIIKVDTVTVDSVSAFATALLDKKDGDRLTFKVLRDGGRSRNIKITYNDAAIGGTIGGDNIGIVAAAGTLNGPVAYSLTNAPFLIVYNVANDTFTPVRNPNRGMAVDAAAWIKTQSVGSVIVGNVTDNDLLNLANANIKVYSGVFGDVKDAVVLYKQGKLIENQNATAAPAGLNLRDLNTIAIPANYPDPSANVAKDFATARYFIVVELDQNKYEVKTNPTYNDMTAGGIRSTHFLVDQQVDAVVASNVELNTLSEMKKLNMHFARCGNSSVGDAIMAFKNGKLRLDF